jgi:hypothetical protein
MIDGSSIQNLRGKRGDEYQDSEREIGVKHVSEAIKLEELANERES